MQKAQSTSLPCCLLLTSLGLPVLPVLLVLPVPLVLPIPLVLLVLLVLPVLLPVCADAATCKSCDLLALLAAFSASHLFLLVLPAGCQALIAAYLQGLLRLR